MVTETDAIKRISSWMKNYGWNIYQDKKNDFNNKLFHVKGESREKPDLIGIKKNYIVAIEVKSGTDSNHLGRYAKTVRYFENYNDVKTLYFDENDDIININDFVIGTYYSKEGKLLHNDEIKECGENHYKAWKRGLNPKNEYHSTFQIIRRGLWDWVDYDKYRGCNTGIGALLSTVLDDNGCKPSMFVMSPHYYFKTDKRRWWHTWKTF